MIPILHRMFKRIRHALILLWKEKKSPAYRARGLAVGVFSGCFPLFGLQTLIGVGLASLVRGSHLLAAVGTWISNPLTYIPLYWLNYKLGSLLLGKSIDFIEYRELTNKELWSQGWLFSLKIFLGSSLIGLFMSIIVGTSLYLFLKYQSSKIITRKN